MIDVLNASVGNVLVETTSGRGSTPEEVAERALDKIIHIGTGAHPAIREQAEAYRNLIRQVLTHYMHEMVRSHNVTLVNKFHQVGHPELASLLDV